MDKICFFFFNTFGVNRDSVKNCVFEKTQTLFHEFVSSQLLRQRKKNLPLLACMCLHGSSINSPSLDSCFDEDSRAVSQEGAGVS